MAHSNFTTLLRLPTMADETPCTYQTSSIKRLQESAHITRMITVPEQGEGICLRATGH